MRYLLLLAFLPALALAQQPNVAAEARLTFQPPTLAMDGKALPAGAVTRMEVFISTSPLLDGALGTPVARLAGTATEYIYRGSVPNGSTLYARVRACTALVCGPATQQASKSVRIDIPAVPPGFNVTVTVTLSSVGP